MIMDLVKLNSSGRLLGGKKNNSGSLFSMDIIFKLMFYLMKNAKKLYPMNIYTLLNDVFFFHP